MNSQPNSSSKPVDGVALIEARRQQDMADIARKHAELRRASRAAELAQRIGASCIPQRYLGYRFDTFPIDHIRDAEDRERAHMTRTRCQRYAETWPVQQSRGTNLVFVGGVGAGKTGLACAIANHVIEQHAATALFMSAYGAVRHQKDCWKRGAGKSEGQAFADLVAPDLLILDEVGLKVGTDIEQLMLFELLNGRYSECKPTILLSNLPVDDYTAGSATCPGLRSFLGERLWDRYSGSSSAVLACDWPSLRGGSPA